MSDMTAFERKIGYTFKDKKLLTEALTHSSYNKAKKRVSNERLEFLGDSVLSVVVSKYLFAELRDVPEGQLTKLRAGIVCEQSLYSFAQSLDLGGELLLGKGEENTGGRQRRSILADAFEALIAAIYLDGGAEAADKFVMSFMPPGDALKSAKPLIKDYKTLLQEIIQQNPEEKITYSMISETGEAHSKTFMFCVLLNGQRIGAGTGKSKKEAEQNAAKEAMKLMGYDD